MNGTELTDLIQDYYDFRNLKFPNFHQAMSWVHSELGEVYELDLARVDGWVRNNPETKEAFSKERLAEELGDAIFMLIVAGLAEGVDPLKAMEQKMRTKMGQIKTVNVDGTVETGLTGKLLANFDGKMESFDGN